MQMELLVIYSFKWDTYCLSGTILNINDSINYSGTKEIKAKFCYMDTAYDGRTDND